MRNYIINNIYKSIPHMKLIGFSNNNAPHIINMVLPFNTKEMV